MFTIYTIGGGEFLRDFFNGVAILVNSSIYASAFKIMIVIGVIWYGFKASNGAIKEAMKWVIVTIIILYVMVFAKATIIVEDDVNPALAGNRIDNVPFGLAVISGIASSLDRHLTAAFEQIFSLPNDLQYSENGMILGSKIIQQTAFANLAQAKLGLVEQRFKTNFQEFIEACVIVNAQQGVPYDISQLKSSQNLWSLISSQDGLSPIFTFKYIFPNGVTEFLTCKEGVGNISGELNEQIDRTKEHLAKRLFPDDVDALTKFQAKHQSTLDYLTSASQNAANSLRQAIMVNEIQQSVSGYASSLGNHVITPYEQARIALQQRNNYRLIGANANSWLVYTKTLFEAVLYALFPLVMLYTIAPFGGIGLIKTYITTFSWLILWGPCYAAINLIASYSNKVITGEALTQGMTIVNQLDIVNAQEQISTMAGWFSMLVPFITLIVFKGMGAMTTLAHKLGSTLESSTGQVANETSTGNIGIGSTSFNNVSANKKDSSHFFKGQGHSTQINDDGLATTTSASGQKTYNTSGMTDSINTSFNVSKQDMNSVSNSISSIESQVNSKAISNAISNGFNVSSSDQFSQSEQDSMRESMNFTKTQSNDLSKSTGLTQQQVLSASAGIKGGMDIWKFKAEFGASLGQSVTSTEAFNQLESFSKSKQFSNSMDYIKQNAANESIAYTDSSGKNVTSTIDEAMRTSKDYSIQLSNMQQMSHIQNENLTHKYIESLERNYDQRAVEGILNHKDHNYDNQRAESLSSFSKSQAPSNNNFVNQSAVGQREFLSKFEDNLNQTQGYSNSSIAEESPNMIQDAKWNIDGSAKSFDNNFQKERGNISNRADDDVGKGSYKAVRDNIKNLNPFSDE